MSLLMKALKKAEESQQGASGASVPTLQELAEELSLEPRAQEAAPAKKPALDPRPSSGNEMPRDAANLFAAKEPEGDGRKRLLLALSAVALLLLAGGGAYVYIAINQPGLLIAARPATPPPSAPAAMTVAALPEESRATPAESPAFLSMPAEQAQPRPAGNPASSAAVPAEKNREVYVAEPSQESAVKVLRGTQAEISPDLAQGYQALQEGRLEAARPAYQRLLQQEPRNVDALLGMAAVAARSNNPGEAGRLYLRALDVEPGNAFAQAGLLNLLGSADPAGSEAKLKRLLADQPSAFLHFALGNLYAAEARWPDAQQAYFQAHRLAPANPDYAFNLAVSLDHINQPKPALVYYQRALELLGRDAAAAFNRAAVEARMAQLKRMAE